MLEMTPAELYALAAADPPAATAIATVALMDATKTLANATYGLVLVGIGQIGAIFYGIWSMTQSGKRRAREHDQRHQQAMDDQAKRHDEAMTSLRALIRQSRPNQRAVLRASP